MKFQRNYDINIFKYLKLESLETLNDFPEVTELISSRAGTGCELSQILDCGYCNHIPWFLQPQSWGSTETNLDLTIYPTVQSERQCFL